MAEHDQRFKTLAREFFAELIALLFTKWAAKLDLARLDWLDKELMPDPPSGQGFYADLVVRVATHESIPALRPEEKASDSVLVHLEAEAEDRVTGVRARAYDYHKYLRDRYHVPVLTGALYLRVGLKRVGIRCIRGNGFRRRAEPLRVPLCRLPRSRCRNIRARR